MNPPADRQQHAILPAAFYHPLHLLWIAVAPLTVLLLINAHAAWFAWDEIGRDKQPLLRVSLLLTAVWPLALGAAALAGFFLKRRLTAWWFVALLFSTIALCWGNNWLLFWTVPSEMAVPQWIFDYDILFAAQFACAMPLCFYALIGLACTPLKLSLAKDITLSVLLLVIPPAVFACVGFVYALMMRMNWDVNHTFFTISFIILVIFGGILTMLGLLRLLTRFYIFLNRFPWVLVTVSALLMPLGGLALNYAIPFPSSFQTTGIYVWTLINAAALLLGCVPALKKIPALWLAQMLTFPFTLYFFILFLPWLPLFVPAMVASGAGFLILTPTVLFMVHGQRLIDGFKHSAAILGKPLTVTLGLAALLALPAWFGVQAALDRAALRESLDYVYHSDPFPRQPLTVSPRRVTRTLEKLNNYQEGQYLPILSNFYNWSVFDNLFLPDNKLKEMYLALSGKELPVAEVDRATVRSMFALSNRDLRRANARRPAEFPREKISTTHSVTVSDDGDCQRATLTLSVTNRANEQNEYVAKLKLSPAVMVSGLRLLINGEKVDGRLFEQKTALWVYNQIRDRQRRDPALLRYTADDEIELRVFPLEKKETRVVEVEFIYPKNSGAYINFNEKNILHPSSGDVKPLILTKFSDQQAMLTLTETPQHVALMSSWEAGLPIQRTPYHHFIIERSADTQQWTAAELLKKIHDADRQQPMKNCKITFANFESKLMTPVMVPLASLDKAQLEKMMGEFSVRGGFLQEKVLREETAAHEEAMRRDDPQSFLTFPSFTFILSGTTQISPLPLAFSQETVLSIILADRQRVYAFASGGHAFVAADSEFERFSDIVLESHGREFYGFFKPLPPDAISVVINETYKKGAAAFALQDELNRHPSRAEKLLPLLVKASRESGVMVPATAYIVVERNAQWKILSEKEKQKLAANQALELEADVVPEPATWALLLTALAVLTVSVFVRRLRKPAVDNSHKYGNMGA